MGLFPKRSKSKLKQNEGNYLTISTPTKQSESSDAQSKKVWKGFRGFHARSKKSKKKSNPVSPRTVMMEDPSLFDIGCFETNGDTSYEVSFLSDNSLASPGKPETYYHGRSAVESTSKLNTSAASASSFSSLIRRRSSKSKSASTSTSASSSTFEPSQKTDVFDNYYKKEEESKKSAFDGYYESEEQHQVPIQSLRHNRYETPKKEEEEKEDIPAVASSCIELEGSATNETEVELTTTDVALPSSTLDSINTSNSAHESTSSNQNASTSEASPDQSKQTASIQESQSLSAEQSKLEPTTSFVDSIPCNPLAQFFACATDLAAFEKMLFGDDLLPSCSPCGPLNDNDDKLPFKTARETTSSIDQSVESDEIQYDDLVGNDNSFLMVDTFLSYATKRGVPLTYYKPKDVQESEWDAHEVTLYVTPGRRDDQVSVPPKLMWVARDNGTHSNANIYQHFDLSEIDSILKPEENGNADDNNNYDEEHSLEQGIDPDNDENEMEHVCFSIITKAGQVFIFEASSDKQRNFVVDSLQLVVSRLAFV